MKIAGLICEYNPFHNGHKYQTEVIKKENDALVCVMSGDFVQRGDAAIFDKYLRAEAALKNGCDLVVELPVIYSVNSAEVFAFGGVSLLDSMGVCDTLYFGSECEDISQLEFAAEALMNEDEGLSAKIRSELKSGKSYPSAIQSAYAGIISADILSQPNNILGIEYISAIKRLGSKMRASAIKRYMTEHNSDTVKENIASATKIRTEIFSGGDWQRLVPPSAYDIFKSAPRHSTSKLLAPLLYKIRTSSPAELAHINEVSEGLENRIIAAAARAETLDALIDEIKTKRYTRARIQRILLSILLGLDAGLSKKPPEYIRVLGMNGIGKKVLREIKESSAAPIITKAAAFKQKSAALERDILAADIYSLTAEGQREPFSRAFTASPIVLP